jgi:hypothetical protein
MVQRGKGLGGIFSSLLRTIGPTLKTVGQSSLVKGVGEDLLASASKGGLAVVSDALAGKNILKSLKSNFIDGGKNVASATVKRHQRKLKLQQQQQTKKKQPLKGRKATSAAAAAAAARVKKPSRGRKRPPPPSPSVDSDEDDSDGVGEDSFDSYDSNDD